VETPFLVLLERAELAAAEARQAARVEADQRLEQARTEAETIEAAAPEAVAAAIAARRQQILDAALREVASVETALAAVEDLRQRPDPEADRRFERAVEQIVSAVLGETAGP
jgi:hypothetical protein